MTPKLEPKETANSTSGVTLYPGVQWTPLFDFTFFFRLLLSHTPGVPHEG